MSSVARVFAMLLAVPLVGTVAFMIVERMSFFDSLYMAVITLTTVGFEEVQPLSTAGRVVVILYLISGLGVFHLRDHSPGRVRGPG